MKDEDREIIVEMIKSRVEKAGYSDEAVAKEANEKNLFPGSKVTALHVATIRRQAGLKHLKGRRGRRSTKTMEEACAPAPRVRKPGAKAGAKDHSVKYQKIGAELGALCDRKQVAYGDSFGRCGEILAVLYPHGVRMDQYGDMLTVARIIDKLFRIATDKDALGESPYKDIVGYGLLGAALHDERRQAVAS